MDRICGGQPLSAKIKVGCARNTTLPLTAELLTDGFLIVSNVRYLADNQTMGLLLELQGKAVEPVTNDGFKLSFAGSTSITQAPYNLVRGMCAAFGVPGYLLAWMSGAPVSLSDGYVGTRAKGRLRCATTVFPFFTIGATENLLMPASPPEGLIILTNGARMGGIGNDKLTIDDVDRLRVVDHPITPARIGTGSNVCAAVIAGGSVSLRGARLDYLGATAHVPRQPGVDIVETPDELMVKQLNGLYVVGVMTEPYPEFSTDCQLQFIASMLVVDGASTGIDEISENRFPYVPGSNRMGSDQFAWNISYRARRAVSVGSPVTKRWSTAHITRATL